MGNYKQLDIAVGDAVGQQIELIFAKAYSYDTAFIKLQDWMQERGWEFYPQSGRWVIRRDNGLDAQYKDTFGEALIHMLNDIVK